MDRESNNCQTAENESSRGLFSVAKYLVVVRYASPTPCNGKKQGAAQIGLY